MKLFLTITNIVLTIASAFVCLACMCYAGFQKAKNSWERKDK